MICGKKRRLRVGSPTPKAKQGPWLRDDLLYDVRVGNDRIGQSLWPSVMRKRQLVVVKPKLVEQCCMQVIDGNAIFDGTVAKIVGCAVNVA